MTLGHVGEDGRADLEKGIPSSRATGAKAKRQDLSLVCLGNNQEGAGTGGGGGWGSAPGQGCRLEAA